MSITRLDIVERNVEKAHIWVNGLAEELGTEDYPHAYRVLRGFLHTLRDHLSTDETAQLAAQLPIFIRGVFYEGWKPSAVPQRPREAVSFLTQVADEALLAGETEASFATAAGWRVLARHVSAGETASLEHALPEHIRALLRPDEE
jgi:uncharacterized protein (DUF2267 family)